MMDAQFEAKLIECLSALDDGQSIEQVLARYPGDAAELRPILMTAGRLSAFRMEPSEAQKMKSRQAFLAQAQVLQARPAGKFTAFRLWPRLAATFGALVLVIGVLGGGAVVASGSALPGDPLYGFKRIVEDARLALSGNNATLSAQFAQTRIDEINALLDAGREVEVAFRSPIESVQPNTLIIAGLVVQRTADTQVIGTPQIDRTAEVRALTGPGGLVARSIIIAGSDEPSLISTPAPTPTPRPAMTPTPAPTETRPPQTPAPTSTPAPTPTARPVEIEFTGTVNSLGDQQWVIDGAAVLVNAQTEIRGAINVGQRVKVNAWRLAGGQIVARLIEALDGGDDDDAPGGNDNTNPNDDDDSNGNDNGDNKNHNGDDDDNDDNQNGDDNQNDNDDQNDNDNQNNGNSNNANDND